MLKAVLKLKKKGSKFHILERKYTRIFYSSQCNYVYTLETFDSKNVAGYYMKTHLFKFFYKTFLLPALFFN